MIIYNLELISNSLESSETDCEDLFGEYWYLLGNFLKRTVDPGGRFSLEIFSNILKISIKHEFMRNFETRQIEMSVNEIYDSRIPIR